MIGYIQLPADSDASMQFLWAKEERQFDGPSERRNRMCILINYGVIPDLITGCLQLQMGGRVDMECGY